MKSYANYKLGVVSYLPRREVGNVDAFLANLDNYPTKYPLHLFSHEYSKRPGVIGIPANIEDAVNPDSDGKKNLVHIYNMAFYTGVSIAASMGLTHFIFIEYDCRFGRKNWDAILFREFFLKNPNAACGGTPVMFNPCSYNLETARGYEQYVASNEKKLMPMATAASGKFGERQLPSLFPIAALAIYNVAWLLDIFPEISKHKTVQLAHTSKLHDLEVGQRLWKQLEHKVFENVTWLNSEYSGYKDILSTEDSRREMLESKKVVAVHQIKSDWIGPEPKPIKP
jgi:hypothetical protein